MIVSSALDSYLTVWERSVDRRQHERFPVADEVFLTFRPSFERIGSVKDISKTGISFEYLAFEEGEEVEYVDVDVFSASQDLYISRIPCRIVYDIRKEPAFILRDAETRRCGMEFGELSEQQASAFASFFGL